MPDRSDPNVTALLEELAGGDVAALDRLFPLVYEELQRVAHGHMNRERAGHTLDTTALVHDTYLKLVRHPPRMEWQSRIHFFAVAARAMRQELAMPRASASGQPAAAKACRS